MTAQPTITPPNATRRNSTEATSGHATQRYVRNLAALRTVQPSAAALVEAASITQPIEFTPGRDGSPTLRLRDADGRWRWFGGSSMPTVSAAELFSTVRADVGNVSLPGILTGHEPLAILERLPGYRAVFIFESDPIQVKLAMHLYDYTAALAGGQLVMIVGDEIEARLSEFFETRPGCELPTQLFTVPQHSAAQIAVLQKRLEQAGESVLHFQSGVTETLSRALAGLGREGLPKCPRTAVLSLDPSAATAQHVRRIARALEAMGWAHEVCIPDSPDRCHVVARLQAVERVGADWVLLVNSSAGSLRGLLPTSLPVATWFLPGGEAPRAMSTLLGPHDAVFASTSRLARENQAAGVPQGRVLRCEVGADDVCFGRVGPTDTNPDRVEWDAAVFLDLPDDRPEGCGLTLPSQTTLWRELQGLAEGDHDATWMDDASQILAEAETACGVKLADPTGRETMLSLIVERLAPRAAMREAVETLAAAGLRIGVWGRNAQCVGRGGVHGVGSIPAGEALHAALRTVGLLVVPWLDAAAVQIALDAMAVGKYVSVRGSADRFVKQFPGLSTLVPFLSFYRDRDELVACVRATLAVGEDSARRERLTALVDDEHSLRRRLMFLVDELRRRNP